MNTAAFRKTIDERHRSGGAHHYALVHEGGIKALLNFGRLMGLKTLIFK